MDSGICIINALLFLQVNVGTVQATVECPQALKLPDVEHASSSLQKAEASTRSRGNSTDDFVANDTLEPGRAHIVTTL